MLELRLIGRPNLILGSVRNENWRWELNGSPSDYFPTSVTKFQLSFLKNTINRSLNSRFVGGNGVVSQHVTLLLLRFDIPLNLANLPCLFKLFRPSLQSFV